MTATACGHIKLLNKRQEKYYLAEIRLEIEPRFSRRRFRTASLAEEYGKRWAKRYNAIFMAPGVHRNDSKGLNPEEGT